MEEALAGLAGLGIVGGVLGLIIGGLWLFFILYPIIGIGRIWHYNKLQYELMLEINRKLTQSQGTFPNNN
ncbi:hypothetical protein KBA39_05485 [Myxococcota bacterium]|nr:hypothetical protein [Myxococcota bacterium]